MATKKRLIELPDDGIIRIPIMDGDCTVGAKHIDLSDLPTVDAVEVVHGRWEREIGDLHSSGVLYYCSECNKLHLVKSRHSLITLSSHEELFSKPNYCPNCGAKMDGERKDDG